MRLNKVNLVYNAAMAALVGVNLGILVFDLVRGLYIGAAFGAFVSYFLLSLWMSPKGSGDRLTRRGLRGTLFRPFWQIYYRLHGYSGCLICGDSWGWKRHHSIVVGGSGAFPYCEECSGKATKEQKLDAFNRLEAQWRSDATLDAQHEMLVLAIRYMIEEEIA